MGKTYATLNVEDWRYRLDDVGITSSTWNGGWSENTNPTVDVDTRFRVRYGVEETAGASDNGIHRLEFSHEGGAWTLITAGPDHASASAVIYGSISDYITNQASSGSGTTQLLGYSGSETPVDGEGVEGIDSIGLYEATTGPGKNDYLEQEFNLQIRSADVADGDTIALRVLSGTNGVIYTSRTLGTITVNEAAGSILAVKLSDTFTAKPTNVKLGGTFTEKLVKRKAGGSF